MDDFFLEKWQELPRPKSWMPGPPSPWSTIDPLLRTLKINAITSYLDTNNKKMSSIETAFVASSEDPLIVENISEKPSAVLVPFLSHDGEHIDSIILTTRTMTVNSHKGQVSFPGGRVEKSDKDEIDTALREAKEEINLDPHVVEILGQSSITQTRSGLSSITPVVGLIKHIQAESLIPNKNEVEEIHIVDIDQLLSPDAYSCEVWDFGEVSPTIHIYRVFDQNYLPVFIWGATAHILTSVLHCLNA